ncbi:MAG: hypothetical protein ACLGHL_05375 [Actinomycetota bacterium]
MTQDSLATLRAEVEAAFEEATSRLAHLLEVAPDVVDVSVPAAPAAPAAPRAMAPPPPPPPPALVDDDPLDAFAPPPHMDWGPETRSFLRRHVS